ncbi:hypothetical protein NJBCHELONAE_13910 [Mycobacteroides chelonae]|nr:hypothetical protein NJBCHELONAE_13910 [Mycobacteroides chelonae]
MGYCIKLTRGVVVGASGQNVSEPGGSGVIRLEPDPVHNHAKDVFRIADALDRLNIDSVLSAGSAACPGTDLVSGLSQHAVDEHAHVKGMSKEADRLAGNVRDVVEAFRRADEL